jgi:predicted RND superfamily exporter protein
MYKKIGWGLIATTAILSVFLFYFLPNLKFEYDFEKFFPSDDEELHYFYKHRAIFGDDNNFLLLGLTNEKGIFEYAFLQRVAALTKDLEVVENIDTVISPTHLQKIIVINGNTVTLPYLNWQDSTQYHADSTEIYSHPALVNTFFAQQGKSILLYIQTKQDWTPQEAQNLLENIEKVLQKHQFSGSPLAGKIRAEQVYITLMQTELAVFMSASAVLVAVFLFLMFRKIWAVVVPIFIILLTIAWTLGVMGMLGKNLDLLMVMLPSILFIVGMSDGVHLLSRYLDELRSGKNKIKALQITIKETGLATLLTSITTAIGFFTLLTASISVVRDFGTFTAIGVMIALLLTYLVLPATLLLSPKKRLQAAAIPTRYTGFLWWKNLEENQEAPPAKDFWYYFLHRLLRWVLGHKKAILLVSCIAVIASMVGFYHVQVNTTLLEDLGEKDKMYQDFMFFEEHFGGTRSFEVALELKKGYAPTDSVVIAQAGVFQQYLEDSLQVSSIISLVSVSKGIVQATQGGIAANYRLPQTKSEWRQLKIALKKLVETPFYAQIANDTLLRMSGRTYDLGSIAFQQKMQQLEQFYNKNCHNSVFSYHLTGTSLMIDRNNEYLVRNMSSGIGISVLMVSIIIGVLYRRWYMILLTIVVNILPLLVIGGMMGVFGIPLKISTSIIFTIAFGIALDDTIHFIGKLHLELKKGKSLPFAIKNTFLSTGKAIILTSLIIVAGFLMLMFSSFAGTFYTGLLISLTLINAVLADLFLLPVLLLSGKRNKKLHSRA